jgi:hypothetical protein
LSFCTFSFGHCVVCSSLYGFWLPLWYAQSCTHKASLSPPRFIKVPGSSQVSIRSSICVLWVSSLPMFLRYSDYIVELFFVFHVNTHYSDTHIHIRVENLFYFEMKNRDIWIRVSVWMLQTLSKQCFIYIMVIRKYILIIWWCWWTVRCVQDQHHEVGFNNAIPLKQQSVGRHIIPLWRITFIPSVCSLMLLVERGSSNKCQLFSLWFDPTWARSIALEVSTITISSLMMSYENTK